MGMRSFIPAWILNYLQPLKIEPHTLESLLSEAEQYNKANLELLRLKFIDKSADVASTIITRTVLIIAVSFFSLTLTIGISLWIGDLIGKTYYGFFIVALVYAVIALVVLMRHPRIKSRIENGIIMQLLNS